MEGCFVERPRSNHTRGGITSAIFPYSEWVYCLLGCVALKLRYPGNGSKGGARLNSGKGTKEGLLGKRSYGMA